MILRNKIDKQHYQTLRNREKNDLQKLHGCQVILMLENEESGNITTLKSGPVREILPAYKGDVILQKSYSDIFIDDADYGKFIIQSNKLPCKGEYFVRLKVVFLSTKETILNIHYSMIIK